MKVTRYLEEIEAVISRRDKVIAAAEAKCNEIGKESSMLGGYCDALFTGIIALEGKMVVYHRENYGMTADITLSKRDPEFAFGTIPVYQGYVSYQKLDAETRSEIVKKANDRINADSPEIYTTGKGLKEVFTGDKINAWAQLASDFSQQPEIIAFIMDLNKRFITYCKENGI